MKNIKWCLDKLTEINGHKTEKLRAAYREFETLEATNDSKPIDEKYIDEKLDEYEFDATDILQGDCVPHTPTDFERLLIKDFVLGFVIYNGDDKA